VLQKHWARALRCSKEQRAERPEAHSRWAERLGREEEEVVVEVVVQAPQ
jgi:hypothetical protein